MFSGAEPLEGDLHVVKLSSKKDIALYLEHNEAFENLKKFTNNYDVKLDHNIEKISTNNNDISITDYVKDKMLSIRKTSKQSPKLQTNHFLIK